MPLIAVAGGSLNLGTMNLEPKLSDSRQQSAPNPCVPALLKSLAVPAGYAYVFHKHCHHKALAHLTNYFRSV